MGSGERPDLYVIAIMILLLVPFGCGRPGNGAELSTQADANAVPVPLELRLEFPAQVRVRQPVPMRLVLVNRGDRPVAVELGGEPIAFDLVVVDANGAEVWRRLEGVAIPDILQVRTLAPGGELEFTETWRQQTSRGATVTAGTYRVRGLLPAVASPGGWATAFQTLTISR
jgi:hypothetical protein